MPFGESTVAAAPPAKDGWDEAADSIVAGEVYDDQDDDIYNVPEAAYSGDWPYDLRIATDRSSWVADGAPMGSFALVGKDEGDEEYIQKSQSLTEAIIVPTTAKSKWEEYEADYGEGKKTRKRAQLHAVILEPLPIPQVCRITINGNSESHQVVAGLSKAMPPGTRGTKVVGIKTRQVRFTTGQGQNVSFRVWEFSAPTGLKAVKEWTAEDAQTTLQKARECVITSGYPEDMVGTIPVIA